MPKFSSIHPNIYTENIKHVYRILLIFYLIIVFLLIPTISTHSYTSISDKKTNNNDWAIGQNFFLHIMCHIIACRQPDYTLSNNPLLL